MKTAQELWKLHFETLTIEDIKSIQLDAQQAAADHIIGHLRRYWGHEILRTIAREIAKSYTLPEPREPFHSERLHPGANRPEVPPTAQTPTPERVAEAFGEAPPGMVWESKLVPAASPPSAHPNPKTSNPPRSQAPSPPHPAEACPPCGGQPVPAAAPASSSPPIPERRNAVRGLVQVDLDLMTLQQEVETVRKSVEALWKGPCAPEKDSPSATAWHQWVWGYVEPLLQRIELIEKERDRLFEENSKRATDLATLGEHVLRLARAKDQLQKAQADLMKPPLNPPAEEPMTQRPPEAPLIELALGRTLDAQMGIIRDAMIYWTGTRWLVSW